MAGGKKNGKKTGAAEQAAEQAERITALASFQVAAVLHGDAAPQGRRHMLNCACTVSKKNAPTCPAEVRHAARHAAGADLCVLCW